jgi:multidrug efflux pump subunit AcrB
MNISRPFIERPIATAMLMVAIVLLGGVAYGMLPISALPRVDFPTIQVSASYPGANPETMAGMVATPLERQIGQIPGVSQMISTSVLGQTQVTVQFDASRTIDSAAQDIQTAINAAGGQLPKDLPSPPTYRKTNPADAPVLVLAATSDTLPITRVDDLADTILAQQVSQVPGVGLVTIFGEQKPAVRVRIDPNKIAAMGLSLEDVRAALGTANVERPKGTLMGAQQSFSIDTNDQLPTGKSYEDVIVAYLNGAPVRVRDIGTAIDAAENVQVSATVGTQKAVVLSVMRQPGANVIATVDSIRAMLPGIERSLPPSVRLSIVQDRTQTIRA